jgi:hypothetical protein
MSVKAHIGICTAALAKKIFRPQEMRSGRRYNPYTSAAEGRRTSPRLVWSGVMNRLLLALPFVLACAMPAAAQTRDPVVRFDYREVDARQEDGHWWLYAGEARLKDLGLSENDALAALWVIRELRLTHYSTIGAPEPVIEYWLADGKPPEGILHNNVRILPLHPEALRIEQMQGQWCLCDGKQPMFGFGAVPEDAAQALSILRHYGFNRVGYVGQTTPVMMFFLVSNEPFPTTQKTPTKTKGPVPAAPLALMLPSYQLHVPGQVEGDDQSDSYLVFDSSRLEVCCDGQSWKLLSGTRCLADFGAREEDARDVLKVMQFYRFTERRRVVRSLTAFTYYLTNGEAPRGLMLGVRSVEFRAAELAVRQVGEDWCLCEAGRTVLAAGKSQEEAEQVLQVIQRYQFDHICQLGTAARPVLTFMVQEHFPDH